MYSNFANTASQDAFAILNLGQETLLASMSLRKFVDTTDVANASGVLPEEIAQRELDRTHAIGLAVYILKGLIDAARHDAKNKGGETSGFDALLHTMGERRRYSMQPIVVSLDASLEDLNPQPLNDQYNQSAAMRIFLPHDKTAWVIDGQHRRFAMTMVLDFLNYVTSNRAYPRKGSLFPLASKEVTIDPQTVGTWRAVSQMASACSVSVEIHLGLDVDEQRQIFHDLNNLGKRVAAGISFDFDSSNPVNTFIKDVLIDEGLVGGTVVEKDITDWSQHDGSIARKDLVAVNSILFLNKTNPKTATPLHVEQMTEIARRFWIAVAAIPGFGADQAKLKTVAAQPVVLKALAKLTYDFAKGRKENVEHLNKLLDGISLLDFSHDNQMWSYYLMNSASRNAKLQGLSDYMPSDDGNRDIGARDELGKMRFGAKHNDIFPIIGDMIRWRLGLPSRHATEDEQAA